MSRAEHSDAQRDDGSQGLATSEVRGTKPPQRSDQNPLSNEEVRGLVERALTLVGPGYLGHLAETSTKGWPAELIRHVFALASALTALVEEREELRASLRDRRNAPNTDTLVGWLFNITRNIAGLRPGDAETIHDAITRIATLTERLKASEELHAASAHAEMEAISLSFDAQHERDAVLATIGADAPVVRDHPLAVAIRAAQDDWLKGAAAPTDDAAMFIARRVIALARLLSNTEREK